MVRGSDVLVGPGLGRDKSASKRDLAKRATCKYTQAVAGDGCWAMANRCGISQDQLKQYNGGKSNFCDLIIKGEYYCCSAGNLPDFSPQPNGDGTCKTHKVMSTDDRNKNTWGWQGCQYLIPNQLLCISTGAPPLPASDPLATCGPTVAGTTAPSDMSKINELNPCPLKACCNVWGNCGISKDFCILNPADTKAPGTTQPGANSCVASCGLEITNNGSPPAQFIRIGYFEAFNMERPCLHMLPGQINTNFYTHIHFAFGGISSSYAVEMGNLQPMFEDFKKLTGVKKIMSFGGWSFSTEADTAPIFRQGVTAAQRTTFANNVVQFANDNNLDGLDFDWEYPGAPDIPGIPPGSKDDGPNYLEFLKAVRRRLPREKTLGIAAPASFWYLKGFPIEEISKVVDYIVYMTYDLHGWCNTRQWDYGNKWSTDGCTGGDCLRHQTNRTETESAMVMITKAGVPSNKIIMGLPKYGRSFKMTSPGCTGPMCTFTGPASGAAPGRCTGTQGYISNFEIREIIASKNAQQIKTEEGDEIVVYDGTEWVGWMTPDKYAERSSWFRDLNMGGTSDWAIDLDADYDVGNGPGSGGGGGGGNSGGSTISVIGGTTFTRDGTTGVSGGFTITLPGVSVTVIG
ncbi:glycoside hydrolase superfamily [Paraphoma chrysanthemicola]|uniref:chitinase n=1 Tax=Paraphoma chrysanthemicola TaxID=798071 RepID=A0A8K0RE74_9PLEO|nr:glycoside hydrolase superfamily [Paraphoma chrysanthemicola]